MNSSDEAQIMEAEERLRQAMLNSDVQALDEMIAPELHFTDHFGHVVKKADDLAFHQARLLRLKELAPSEQHIQLHAGFAVVSVLMHLLGSYQDAPVDQRIRYTRVWISAPDGSIQLIASHSSMLQ